MRELNSTTVREVHVDASTDRVKYRADVTRRCGASKCVGAIGGLALLPVASAEASPIVQSIPGLRTLVGTRSPTKPDALLKWGAGIGLLALLIGGWFLLPVGEWADAFQAWIEGLGPWGLVIFALVYIVATVALLPASVLTVVAGLAFGLAAGLAVVVVSATVGATLAFLIARHVAHDRVESLLAKRPKFKAVKAAVSEGGWKIVGLLRLSPVVPFGLQNYFYGVTDISLVQYVLATLFGIVPGTLLYVYLGSAGKAGGDGSWGVGQWGFFAAGLIATLIVVVIVTRQARAKLQEHGVGAAAGGKGKKS
ncbi:MAG: TVP38/TMEM64 family protein [Casimicrobiaceae bacterium]